MTWVLLLIAAWLAVSMPLALLVARAIRTADRQSGRVDEGRPLSVARADIDAGALAPHPPSRRRAGRR
jgi:hypothetical protein